MRPALAFVREGAKDKATGINYGAAATDWESMDSEAVSRPDRKEISSQSVRKVVEYSRLSYLRSRRRRRCFTYHGKAFFY